MRTGWLRHFASQDGRSLARAMILLMGLHAFLAGMMMGSSAFADHTQSILCLAVPAPDGGNSDDPSRPPHADASCCVRTCHTGGMALLPAAAGASLPAFAPAPVPVRFANTKAPRRNDLRHSLAARAPPRV